MDTKTSFRPSRRLIRIPVFALTLIGLLASLTATLPAQAAARSGQPQLAESGPPLPQTGALLGALAAVGDHHGSNHQEALLDFEADAGREMAIDHDYFNWDEVFPSTWNEQSRDQGRTLLLSWSAGEKGGSCVGWANIANGSEDATIDARAADIKAFAAPLFFVFHHEPENDTSICGTSVDFVDAYQHVHDRFVADGVTNVSWVWVLMAYTYRVEDPNVWYPGDNYVDVVGADGYNWYSCPGRTDPWNEFSWVFDEFHAWGMAHGKPELVAEFASMEDPDDPNHKAEWISNAEATIKTWPEIKAVVWYDNGPPSPTCTWWVDSSQASLNAFKSMGADTYFNPSPLITITSSPPTLDNSKSATFEFESSMQGSTFTCEVDSGSTKSCTSPYTFSGLGDGTHLATITATDPNSQLSVSASYGWTIDATAPVASITDGPSSPSKSTSASFKFSSNEEGTFSCQLDSGAPADCDSPTAYDSLGDGSHTFTLTTTDPAGNTSPTANWVWTVDTATPTATITGSPPPVTNEHPTTFTFTSSEPGSTFKCSKDDSSFSLCTSPKTYTWVAEGDHTFEVEAIDPSGNIGTPVSYAWTVDSAKPKVDITAGPANPTKAGSAAFTFTVTDDNDTTSVCQLDSGTLVACSGGTSGTTIDGFGRTVSNGWGTADQGGAWAISGGSASDFAVNGSAATIAVTSTNVPRQAYLPGSWTDTDFLFRVSFDRKPVSSMRVMGYGMARYDSASGAFYALRASLVWDGSMRIDSTKKPALGPEVIEGTEANLGAIGAANTWYWVRGHVADENGSVRIQGRLWKDGTPEPTIWQYSYLDTSSVLAAGQPGLRAQTWALDPTYSVSFDDYSASTGLSYAGLVPGTHVETITSTDAGGNVGTDTWSWTVDQTAPIPSITSGPNSPTGSTSATLKFSANESGGTFTCQLDSGSAATCTSPTTYSGLANGSHVFTLLATDKAGNVSTPVTWAWTVDTVAPVPSITGAPPLFTKDRPATFLFTSNEVGSTFKCSKDGGSYLSCSSPKVYLWFGEGPHTFGLIATDPSGNQSTAITYTWTVDNKKPTVTINTGPPNPDTKTTATFTFSSDDPSATFTCQLDANAAAACTSSKTYSGIGVGAHTFKVYATDKAGNQSSTVTWTWVKV